MKNLLLIDDEADQFKDMFDALESHNYKTVIESSPVNALISIKAHNPDVILLDLHFPGDNLDLGGTTTGANLLRDIQRDFSEKPVVVFTTKLSDDRLSLETMNPQRYYAKEKIKQLKKSGGDWAADLAVTLGQAINDMELRGKSSHELDAEMGFVVGKSSEMRKVVETIRNAAGSSVTVLIEGETGTGKELVARAIHHNSKRRGGPFVSVNCASIPETLLESELFGHVKGAFSGAVSARKGRFQVASGGTLFFDEIGELKMDTQVKLLRAIQERKVEPLGSDRSEAVDVRFIAASNRDLMAEVRGGHFREDLYYRLNILRITLPSLRKRIKESGGRDLPLLWSVLIEKANRQTGKTVMITLRKEVREKLEHYRWPGNIRELENVISRAVVNTKGNILLPQDIDIPIPRSSSITNDNASTEVSPETEKKWVEDQANMWSEDAAKIASRLDTYPAEQRYEILKKNTDGDLQKNVLIEIICRLRAKHHGGKMTSKLLTKYLCGYKGEEKLKKDDQKVRQKILNLKFRLSEVKCKQYSAEGE